MSGSREEQIQRVVHFQFAPETGLHHPREGNCRGCLHRQQHEMGPRLNVLQAGLAKGHWLFLDTTRHGSSITVKMERNLVWLDLLIWRFCSLEDIIRKYAEQ